MFSIMAITWQGLLVDLGIVIIFVAMVIIAAKKGFASTLINFIGSLLAAVLAIMFARFLAEIAFDQGFRENMINDFYEGFKNISSTQPLKEGIANMTDSWPEFIVSSIVTSVTSALQNFEDGINDHALDVATTVVDTTIRPFIVALIELVIFMILFSLLRIFAKFIAKRFKAVNKIPVLGSLNSILGGAIGVLQAAVIVYIGILLWSLIYSLIYRTEIPYAQNSILFKFFFDLKIFS